MVGGEAMGGGGDFPPDGGVGSFAFEVVDCGGFMLGVVVNRVVAEESSDDNVDTEDSIALVVKDPKVEVVVRVVCSGTAGGCPTVGGGTLVAILGALVVFAVTIGGCVFGVGVVGRTTQIPFRQISPALHPSEVPSKHPGMQTGTRSALGW